jgi:hypothetical protein
LIPVEDVANECAKCIEKGKDICCFCKSCLCLCKCPLEPVESALNTTKTTLFTDDELAALSKSYRAKKNSLRRASVVDRAVEHYYTICMSKRAYILESLNTSIENWTEFQGRERQWCYAFSFVSVLKLESYPDALRLETTFEAYGYKMSMWKIYSQTDFCTKLLLRLGLDLKHFCFMNLSSQMEDGALINNLNLVFRG